MPDSVRYSYLPQNNNQYVNDVGDASGVVTIMKVPSDMTVANVATILTAAGATIQPSTIPCLGNSLIKPRRLRFKRFSGHSFSIILNNRAAVKTVYDAVVAAVAGITPTNPVLCGELIGERVTDALGLFALRPNPVTSATMAPIVPPTGSAGVIKYFTGLLAYETDASDPAFRVVPAPFRFATNVLGAPPSALAQDIAIAINLPNATIGGSCSGGSNYDPRHYVLTLRTAVPPAAVEPQTLKIPVADGSTAEILAAGIALSSVGAVQCVDYVGENYKFVHLIP